MAINIDDKTFKKHSKLDNLGDKRHKWQPGESGNPGGRPKDSLSLSTYLKQYLKSRPTEVHQIVISLITMAKSGGRGAFPAIQEIFNRIDGKVAERHEIEGKLPVTLVFQPVIAPVALGQGDIIEGQCHEIPESVES